MCLLPAMTCRQEKYAFSPFAWWLLLALALLFFLTCGKKGELQGRLQGICDYPTSKRCVEYYGYSVAGLNTTRGSCKVLAGTWTEGGQGCSRDGAQGICTRISGSEKSIVVYHSGTIKENQKSCDSDGGSFSSGA